VYLAIQNFCDTDNPQPEWRTVGIQIWNPEGGPVLPGTWPFIDPNGSLSSGSAFLYYGGDPGVGGSVTLTEAGPVYVGSFGTSVNGQTLSGSFSTAAPSQCADP
jgi:hypothetical protein